MNKPKLINKPKTIRGWIDWGLENGHFSQDVYDRIIQNTAPSQDDKPCSSLSCALQSAFFWSHSDIGEHDTEHDTEHDAEHDFWSNINKSLIKKGL